MAKAVTPFTVEMDNGEEFTVQVDQRDWAALEAQDIPESAAHMRTRYLAYSAARRAGRVSIDWVRFNERDCVEAAVQETEDDSEGEQGLDPGNLPTSGTP